MRTIANPFPRFVRFAHQPYGPTYKVKSREVDGMLVLEGMSGSFALHIFIGIPCDRMAVEKTPAGPRLLISDCIVRTWLGTEHEKEAETLCDEINRRIDEGAE